MGLRLQVGKAHEPECAKHLWRHWNNWLRSYMLDAHGWDSPTSAMQGSDANGLGSGQSPQSCIQQGVQELAAGVGCSSHGKEWLK